MHSRQRTIKSGVSSNKKPRRSSTGASAAPASAHGGMDLGYAGPNQQGYATLRSSHWLAAQLRLALDVPKRRSPDRGTDSQGGNESGRGFRETGMELRLPSHKDHPLVIRPKEEARVNRASPRVLPWERSEHNRSAALHFLEQIGSGPFETFGLGSRPARCRRHAPLRRPGTSQPGVLSQGGGTGPIQPGLATGAGYPRV
jgi:hypothetical protein